MLRRGTSKIQKKQEEGKLLLEKDKSKDMENLLAKEKKNMDLMESLILKPKEYQNDAKKRITYLLMWHYSQYLVKACPRRSFHVCLS
jgi:hypothetical protein